MFQILPYYHQILNKENIPRFQFSKLHPITFSQKESTQKLWSLHQQAITDLHPQDIPPSQSLLDLKIELAQRIFTNCKFCERRCQVNRTTTPGHCQLTQPHIASEFLHIGEETPLIPSHTIFFSGCTFNCDFCQNYDISQTITGNYIPPDDLAPLIIKRHTQGSKNVNWVGGDPTSNLPYILNVIKHLDEDIPQIWNSNMYCTTETMALLNGIIDVYLTDYKYGNDSCAERLSNIKNYTTIIQRNHLLAYNQTDVLIRHLILPNHLTCCSQPILQWIQQHTPDAAVNIMAQYHPAYQAEKHPDINTSLQPSDYIQIRNLAQKNHLNLL
jgi:putative pyruvate formate lyase activating enzyme